MPKIKMTKKERNRIADGYLRAAENFWGKDKEIWGVSCCWAIQMAFRGEGMEVEKALSFFKKFFEKDARRLKKHRHVYWFREAAESSHSQTVINRRILGLVWAAHMMREGVFEE